MRKSVFTAITALCTLFATEAMAQDSVAVMKIDVSSVEAESQAAMVLDALRAEVTKSDRTLGDNGSDVTYTEM